MIDKAKLFEVFRRLHESQSSAGSVDLENAAIGIQTSKGDPTYLKRVVVEFKHIAGDNWDTFQDYYNPTKQLTMKKNTYKGRLGVFWKAVRRSQYFIDFISIFDWYCKVHDENGH